MAKLILINTELCRAICYGDSVAELIQAADLLCPKHNYYIQDNIVGSLRAFSFDDLMKIYANAGGPVQYFRSREELDKAIFEHLEMHLSHFKEKSKMSEVENVVEETSAEAPAKIAGISRPKEGTKTGRIWEIADSIGAEATREQVLAVAAEEGINPATASTQFGRWKKFQSNAAA